ncbi:formylglycine-generating enzyme family protein [Leucothrix arctica]|uniref:DNA recombination protein RecF n=1 Tax=Leucothrix arctica TaxID=1481894 RepID=A0A317C832_9GAMM|nr:formylglycine-generating enzyme family protein [Leucothrix arctica]PWQ94776.1 DNA recombination protein RecF [Leucothrix arctica]
MKQTTTRVFVLPVRLAFWVFNKAQTWPEWLTLRSQTVCRWVPMRCFPVQQKEGCQRKRQGLPQVGVSSLLIGFRRNPLLDFMMFSLLCLFLTLPQASHAAVGDEPVTLPPKPCVNTLNTLPEMQLIPAGQFQMGSPETEEGRSNDEGPVHAVSVYRPFALSRCEITVGQFKRFVNDTGYKTDAERGDGCFVLNEKGDSGEKQKTANWRLPNFTQTDDHPVVCVSWQDAKAYTRWLSSVTGAVYRLPTEAEWEYAARTTTASELSRYWGDEPNGCAYANGADQALKEVVSSVTTIADCNDGAVFTQLAGSYQRNAFGLSDMLGNALEWVEDCYKDNYEGVAIDGSAKQEAECARRVLRGGGWNDEPDLIRSANRNRYDPYVANIYFTGFRIARAL